MGEGSEHICESHFSVRDGEYEAGNKDKCPVTL